MKCNICNKENAWLNYIGNDIVCSKCVAKYTVLKEMRFSDEKRFSKLLRKRKIESFEQLKKLKEDELEKIMLEKDDPNIRKYKQKSKDEPEVPIV